MNYYGFRMTSCELGRDQSEWFPCKAVAGVTEADFFFAGLTAPAKINNSIGSLVTGANVKKVPGLNTLGVSTRESHHHCQQVDFENTQEGEIFVFPRGLIHFQKNNGDKGASVISAFNSQLPGTQSITVTLFSATPAVPDNVLTKAFQVGTKEIDKIKSRLASKKS